MNFINWSKCPNLFFYITCDVSIFCWKFVSFLSFLIFAFVSNSFICLSEFKFFKLCPFCLILNSNLGSDSTTAAVVAVAAAASVATTTSSLHSFLIKFTFSKDFLRIISLMYSRFLLIISVSNHFSNSIGIEKFKIGS